MDFNINKGATLPILRLELIQNGRDNYMSFYNAIQNANITFSMTDVISGIRKIGKKMTGVSLITPESCVGEEYYLIYQFSENETNKAGRYVGQFNIDFLDGSGTLIVPITEDLYINILDGNIKK